MSDKKLKYLCKQCKNLFSTKDLALAHVLTHHPAVRGEWIEFFFKQDFICCDSNAVDQAKQKLNQRPKPQPPDLIKGKGLSRSSIDKIFHNKGKADCLYHCRHQGCHYVASSIDKLCEHVLRHYPTKNKTWIFANFYSLFEEQPKPQAQPRKKKVIKVIEEPIHKQSLTLTQMINFSGGMPIQRRRPDDFDYDIHGRVK